MVRKPILAFIDALIIVNLLNGLVSNLQEMLSSNDKTEQ